MAGTEHRLPASTVLDPCKSGRPTLMMVEMKRILRVFYNDEVILEHAFTKKVAMCFQALNFYSL